MPGWYIICPNCKGSGIDPEDEKEEEPCPKCADSGNPGHIWRESFM